MDQGGDIKVQGRGIVVQEGPYGSAMLPEEELKRLDIVRGGGWPSTRPKMVPEAVLCSILWLRV